jgi:hypothetical protein
MDQQRQGSGGNRRRRRKHRGEPRANVEPVMIAARRPNSPLLSNGNSRSPIAASASPTQRLSRDEAVAPPPQPARSSDAPPRRAARIVKVPGGPADDLQRQRQRLLERVMESEGRLAITRAAREYRQASFEFPLEQGVQLQLLEHFDEDQARSAIAALTELLEREPALKKPILDQRLRRLEEYGEESGTRELAAALRRALRSKSEEHDSRPNV